MVITNFKFTRKLVTNDTKADHPITAGSMKYLLPYVSPEIGS